MTTLSILSSKLTSKTDLTIKHGGFIDKIELGTRLSKISVIDLKKSKKFCIKEVNIGKYNALRFFKDSKLDVLGFYNQFGIIYKIQLNPSNFNSWNIFLEKISFLWIFFDFKLLKVQRIDLTIDIREHFDLIYHGFVVSSKSSISDYKANQQTGATFGKGNEVIKIYNKTIKAKLSFPCTRIEIAIKGKKLPDNNFINLIQFLSNKKQFREWCPFRKISLNKVCVKNITNNNKSIEAYHQLKIVSFLFFKLKHNQSKNFRRDYKDIVTLKPFVTQPETIITAGLEVFFKND